MSSLFIKALIFLLLFVLLFTTIDLVQAKSSPTKRAERIAKQYWEKRVPRKNCGVKKVRIKTVNRIAKNSSAWGQAPIGGCIYANKYHKKTWIKVTREAKRADWIWYCSLMIHEWGHLVGKDHNDNKKNIMYMYLTEDNLRYKACGVPRS